LTRPIGADTVSTGYVDEDDQDVRAFWIMHRTWLICGLLMLAGCLPSDRKPAISPVEKMELETLSQQLADPARSAKTKLEAARLMLTRRYAGATEALVAFLSDQGNPSARVAIAQAIASSQEDREAFIGPLVAMARAKDQSVRLAAGKALATYENLRALHELIRIAQDRSLKTEVRTDAVLSLQYALDKQAVEALIGLLRDGDYGVQTAAVRALKLLTNVNNGDDPQRWIDWWQQNKDKSRWQWMRQWADGLLRRNRQLMSETQQLRARLARAMEDMYAASPPPRREALLVDLLKDPISDVRLAGLRLLERRLSANEAICEQVRSMVRPLLVDTDERIRRSAALLLAKMRDTDALSLLLDRLGTERSGVVVQALLGALGQLGNPAALDAVIEKISAEQSVAAPAAAALAGIASKNVLEGDVKDRAARALIQRYKRTSKDADGPALREALLTAMGELGGSEFLEALRSGLSDPDATVRLAAVKGLAKIGGTSVGDWLAPMAADPDRGVRQAAISALGQSGGLKHLQQILERTSAQVEPDEAVRRSAWDVLMKMLAKADARILSDVAARLEDRTDAVQQRVQVLQMLVNVVGESDQAVQAKEQLADALLRAERPSEAAAQLAELYRLASQRKLPSARRIWTRWVAALLAADDPAAMKVIAEQTDPDAFGDAVDRLQQRLEQLIERQRFSAAVLLASEAIKQLPQRLKFEQREVIAGLLATARQGQQQQDRREVGLLTVKLISAEQAVRDAATEKLQAMGQRAVGPLLDELAETIQAEQPDKQMETAILSVLGKIAPKLTGYDPAAAVAEKLAVIESWRKQL